MVKLKICFLADSESVHTQRWCRYFSDLGHEVFLISFKPKPIENVQFYFIDGASIDVKGKNWKVIFKSVKIRKLVKKIDPDILHSLYATSYGLVGALTGFHPYFVTTLGSDILISPVNSAIYRSVLKFTFKRTDCVTLMADHMLETALKLKLVSAEKCMILPFGIDSTIFYSEDRVLNLDEFIITSTRNFEEIYNIPQLLRAVAGIKSKIPCVRLNLIGDGTLRNYLEELAEELGIKENTFFYGKIKQNEIADILRKSHVFCTLSLSDGNNISLNEAMACGTVCIASSIPANTQWIQTEKNGYLVEINDYEKLANLLEFSFWNYTKIQPVFLKINKEIIHEKADWFLNMKRMESKYYELCKK